MISVLCPTRGRPDQLTRSIASLRDNADEPVEVVFRVDNDDPDTLTACQQIPDPKIVLVGPRHGYYHLQNYINECAAAAHGDWLLLWNDDAYMKTPGWTTHIRSLDDGTLKVLNPHTNHRRPDLAIFPIIPRRMYEILGHYSFNTHNDTWIQMIAQYLDCLTPIDIEIFHDRWDLTGGTPDQTALEVEYQPNFFAEQNLQFMKRDARTLQNKWVDYNFDTQKTAWMRLPVDDLAYYSTTEMLAASDDELRVVVDQIWDARYDPAQWRNHHNGWVRYLHLDTPGRTILDFGCGIGVDGLRMARAGNQVILADINEESVLLAERVFHLYGQKPAGLATITGSWPYIDLTNTDWTAGPIDEFYASGVLHHTADAPNIIRRAMEIAPIARLMLYSDGAWHLYSGGDRDKFIRAMDPVGHYADWYSPDVLTERFGKWATILDVKYITNNQRYLVATLGRRVP